MMVTQATFEEWKKKRTDLKDAVIAEKQAAAEKVTILTNLYMSVPVVGT